MNFKEIDCISHVPQHLAGMDKHADNSCKRRAEYLRRFLSSSTQGVVNFYAGEVSMSGAMTLLWKDLLLKSEPKTF